LTWWGAGSSGALSKSAGFQEDAFGRGIYFDNCEPDLLTRATIDVTVGIAIVYFAATCTLLLQKLSRHRKLSYRLIQVGTVFTRLQVSSKDQNASQSQYVGISA